MSDKKEELAQIVGAEHVLDDPEILDAYSKDQSFVPSRRPRLVVKPLSADQVQGIVTWANQTNTPLVPVSSGAPHFRGDSVPGTGGAVMVDLGRMNRIIRVDRRNRIVMIEPGVTFAQLQPELTRARLKLSMPLLPRGNKSVIASLLEREPILIPRYQWTLLEPLRDLEVIWGNGSKLWTGDAGPWGSLERQWQMGHAQIMPMGWGQVDYYRFVSGAQGTMGIVTWATVKCEVLPQVHKVLFAPSEKLDSLYDFAYRLLRIKYADEFLFLNRLNLASILAKDPDGIRALEEELPPWVLILGLAGRERLPEERVQFQEKDIREMAQQCGTRISGSLAGIGEGAMLNVLINPCEEPYWKLRYKGGFQDILFLTTLDRSGEMIETIHRVSESQGYSPSEIGVYIQPLMRGVGVHCEFRFPYNPDNAKETARVQRVITEGSQALMNRRAYFSRPYGEWAEMVYSRDTQNTMVLRKLKKIFDPNNVMNPGKLCF